jgi:hypothetical protein
MGRTRNALRLAKAEDQLASRLLVMEQKRLQDTEQGWQEYPRRREKPKEGEQLGYSALAIIACYCVIKEAVLSDAVTMTNLGARLAPHLSRFALQIGWEDPTVAFSRYYQNRDRWPHFYYLVGRECWHRLLQWGCAKEVDLPLPPPPECVAGIYGQFKKRLRLTPDAEERFLESEGGRWMLEVGLITRVEKG